MRVYRYTFWASVGGGEYAVSAPVFVSRNSEQTDVLFYPRTRAVRVSAASPCLTAVEPFEGRAGVYVSGRVSPAVAGVTITLVSKETQQSVVTDANGKYRAGPLYDDQKYTGNCNSPHLCTLHSALFAELLCCCAAAGLMRAALWRAALWRAALWRAVACSAVSASADGYHFKEEGAGEFRAVRLGQIAVSITDAAGAGVAGVLLALSGGDTTIRRTNQTDANGNFVFSQLFPGEVLTPPHQPPTPHPPPLLVAWLHRCLVAWLLGCSSLGGCAVRCSTSCVLC